MPDIREQIAYLRSNVMDAEADTMEKMLDALEILARLGNEPHLGNSDGNMIARKAIEP